MSIAAHLRRPHPCLRPTVLLSLLSLPVMTVGVFACQDNQPHPLVDAAVSATDAAPAPDAADAVAAMMPACPGSADPIDPTALIDNFENGTSNLLPSIGGRVGGWYSVGDGTPTALLEPRGAVAPEAIVGGRCGSHRALHLTGAGFLDWGAQVLTPLLYGANDAGVSAFLPYNGSQYRGITFFARIGDTSSTNVRFGVADEYARPEAGLCVLGGGFGTGCYDTFGIDLAASLGTDWREFHVPFLGLAPKNIGLHANALDTSKIYDIEFNFAPNVVFDLWVDDISFY